MGQRGEKPQAEATISESFYTVQDTQEAFQNVEEEVSKWRAESERKTAPSGILSSVRNILGVGTPRERFVEGDKIPPRLIRLSDATGPIYFEFTEVEGGGTVLRATYGSALKGRIAKLKTVLPVRIPGIPVGLKCTACGKPVLNEFKLCPYCGTSLNREQTQ